jgi:asparagine synthase (glutamine-hydrolysing)
MTEILGCLALGDALPQRLCHDSAVPPGDDRRRVRAPVLHRSGSFTLALLGSPTLAGDVGRDVLDRILEIYRREGTGVLGRLRGPFALAIVDSASANAVLAIDRMGVEQLAWSVDGEALLFGTSAGAVARLRASGTKLNRQALFDFVLAHIVPAPDTAFADVQKLIAGTCLEVRGARVTVRRYWNVDFTHAAAAEVPALQAAVLPTLERAIARCNPGATTGTFLSGGLDSSTVTGLLARAHPGAHAFSVGFGVDEFNELSYARLASSKFGCKHHIYEVVPDDIVELIPRVAAAYDEPFGNSSAVPTLCCARLAKQHGMDHLLAGDGGDEIFGGNARYVRQKVFEVYGRIPNVLRRALFEPLANAFDPETAPLPLRKLSSYVRQARVPLPERFESWNLVYREGPNNVFDARFLESIDVNHPLHRMREFWEECPSRDLLDRMLWYDWKLTLADNDLRKVSRMCELAGIRVSYPMLDEEVVDLSIRVPSNAKIVGQELRTFFKNAARALLPQEIIDKEKHGFGLPFGVWLKSHEPLQKLVYGALESLRERNIVSRTFIDRVLTDHRSGHAGYYGYAIWDCVMLEKWLELQPPSAL